MSYTAARETGLLPVHPGDRVVLLVIAVYAGLFVALRFVFDTPHQIFDRLIAITTSRDTLRDTLLTDYFGVGGVGAAGFIHSSVAQRVGSMHGGLNLYTNGIVASLLVPIMLGIQSRRRSVEFSKGPEDSPTPSKRQEQP